MVEKLKAIFLSNIHNSVATYTDKVAKDMRANLEIDKFKFTKV